MIELRSLSALNRACKKILEKISSGERAKIGHLKSSPRFSAKVRFVSSISGSGGIPSQLMQTNLNNVLSCILSPSQANAVQNRRLISIVGMFLFIAHKETSYQEFSENGTEV